MRNDSNIVSFEDAKRSVRGRFISNGFSTQTTRSNVSSDPAPLGKHRKSSLARGFDKNAKADGGRKTQPVRAHDEETHDAEDKLSIKEAKKRARNKAKAERAFNKMYGGEDAANKGLLGKISRKNNAPASDSAGPRAAVYKAEMGAKHRKAAAMQSGKKGSGFSFRLPFGFGKPSRKENSGSEEELGRSHSIRGVGRKGRMFLRVGMSVVCLVVLCAAIYAPAQQCYVQIRERDRLAAEYDAVMQRNQILENNVENLQSNAGVEDLAHSSFGLVKDGENAGSVSGVDIKDKSSFTAKIIPGSVPAPETWYSNTLDWLFGYSG